MKPSVAFIGLGVMGHRMLTNMARHSGFNLALAWDPVAEFNCIVKQPYPDISIGESAQQIITDPRIDSVLTSPAFPACCKE